MMLDPQEYTGDDVVAARRIHERLIGLGIHPDPPLYSGLEALRPFSMMTSPCDGCIELWLVGKDQDA
jgi:hypothetical protein